MDEKAIMIQGEDGGCWLQTVDEQGRRRSSYVGRLRRSVVEAWCGQHGVSYYQMRRVEQRKVNTNENSNEKISA
jgi:hypothetical protein